MTTDKMKWHGLITPEQNVYYRVNILFPEVIFAACAVPRLYHVAKDHYGVVRKGIMGELPPIPYADFYRGKANLNAFYVRLLFMAFWCGVIAVVYGLGSLYAFDPTNPEEWNCSRDMTAIVVGIVVKYFMAPSRKQIWNRIRHICI